jgi:DNA-binding GntR family transcriptional regulator
MRKNAVWPEIRLDHASEAPTLRHQIERQLRQAIRNGALACGARLPSSRLMAKLLVVSRGTVVEAYEALQEAGLIVAAAGSGVRVARPSPGVPNFNNLKKTAAAAHYPARVCLFEDQDGTPLYLNLPH